MYSSEEDYEIYYYGPSPKERSKSKGCARFIEECRLTDHSFADLKSSISELLKKLQQNWERFSVFMEHLDHLPKVLSALMETE